MPLLAVEDLRVEFPSRRGAVIAVERMSLDVEPGEILGIVGESGAGKSTIGNAILGLLEPPGQVTGGRMWLDGRDLGALAEAERKKLRGNRIGMIFQDPLISLNPLYTVGRQLVETIRTHLGLTESAAEARAIRLLDQVGIEEPRVRLRHYPHRFSGGIRQRVVIALALCADPELLIADEPKSALDVSIQAQILNLLKDLQKEMGLTMLFISHDLPVSRQMCDRIGVMRHGRLIDVAESEDLFERPRHDYTRTLLDLMPKLEMLSREELALGKGQADRFGPVRPGSAELTTPALALPALHGSNTPVPSDRAACMLEKHADPGAPGRKPSSPAGTSLAIMRTEWPGIPGLLPEPFTRSSRHRSDTTVVRLPTIGYVEEEGAGLVPSSEPDAG